MNLIVNNEQIDVKLEDEKTVGDVLRAIQLDCDKNNASVIGINLDGTIITTDNFDECIERELKSDTQISLDIIAKTNIEDSFKKLSSLFKDLSEKMEKLPVDLQSGHEKEAHNAIEELADNIEEFCHVARLSSLFKEYDDIKIDGKNFQDFFSDFSPILRDFEDALKSNDTISVGDLAEYEICPRLLAISKTLEEIT